MLVRSRSVRIVAALAALTLTAAACGDDDDSDVDASAQETTEATEDSGAADPYGGPSETTEATDDAAAGGAAVEVGDSDLGEILTSGGMTLYIFTPDDGGASTCYDDCAATWPPLIAEGDVTVGEDLDSAMFATVARDDGSEQVTVDGWPLYFFANDGAPGDVNGQGLGGNWWVVGPDGAAIME